MEHAVMGLLLASGLLCAQESKLLELQARIGLPGVQGRIDHLGADIKGQRLFVAALGNQTLEVIDVRAGKRLRTIPGLAEPQGVYYDAGTNRIYVACAKDGAVKVFDGTGFQLLATARFSSDADNVRYDTRGRRIIVGYGEGALGLMNEDGKKTGEIKLDAHPESFQLEKAGTRAFVNVPDSKEIEVVDLVKGSVISRWPVTSALKNFPMALDEAHHTLLIGCRAPARMLAIDMETGKQTDSVETVGDTDDLFYDASRNRVYVIGGQGFVDVLERKKNRFERQARYSTAPGARTGLFVADWGKLFVAVPHRGEQPAQILAFETHP
ncbi:MAG: hypothetical protein U0Q18_12765 [Bryobacteraceae bacterium]